MVRDRLAELQKKNSDYQTTSSSPQNNNKKDDHIIIEINSIDNKILTILNEFIEIRNWIDDIKDNIKKMKEIVGKLQTTFQSSKHKLLLEEMEQIRSTNMSICQKIYTKMKDFEINLPFKDDYTIVSRIKRTQYYGVREDFINVWRENEIFLINYEERIKKTLMRQAKIVDVNITEEETEELIANKKTSLFVGNILEETAQARQILRELLVRQSELEKIERSITEVRDMFLRISTLVMEQSALIQVVEYHAQQATMNVDKGADELEKAKTLKVKYLKRKTCILIWVVVILTVLILILLIL